FRRRISRRLHRHFAGKFLRDRNKRHFKARNLERPILPAIPAVEIPPFLRTIAESNNLWCEPLQRHARHQRVLQPRPDGRLRAMEVPTWIVFYKRSLADLHAIDLNGRTRRGACDGEFVSASDRGKKNKHADDEE